MNEEYLVGVIICTPRGVNSIIVRAWDCLTAVSVLMREIRDPQECTVVMSPLGPSTDRGQFRWTFFG